MSESPRLALLVHTQPVSVFYQIMYEADGMLYFFLQAKSNKSTMTWMETMYFANVAAGTAIYSTLSSVFAETSC
jgi:hypothetical protein